MRNTFLAVIVGLLLVPVAAWPCGNGVYLETDDAVAHLNKAERHLAAGRYTKARNATSRRSYAFPTGELAQRARIIYITATTRLREQWDMRSSTYWLERRIKETNDPVLVARLGEAYAYQQLLKDSKETKEELAKRHRRGLELLEDLHTRDIGLDAHGYAALAQLRTITGDVEGGRKALAKCHDITPRKSICKLEPPAAPTPKTNKRKHRSKKRTGKPRS